MLNRRTSLGLMAAAAMLGLTTGAFAQTGMPGPGSSTEVTGTPTYIMVFYPDGRMVSVPLDKKMAGEAMAHAKAMTGAMMVLISNGKAYAVEDMKMASGEMMSHYLGSHMTEKQ